MPVRAVNVPVIAIIIDDMGNQLAPGRRVVALPGPLTLAFLPFTPYARALAERAHRSGKEVMLHLPMEAETFSRLDSGGLTLHMNQAEFLHTVRANLNAIPHVRGLNNHMGSLLTRYPGPMNWLMAEIAQRGDLYFVDSRTTHHTVAQQVADEHHLPNRARDVFLDHQRTIPAIREQFTRFMEIARHNGAALAIGHPYPETLAVLEEVLPRLEAEGLRLVPVSQLITEGPPWRPNLWQASWSHSPKAAKNSKP